ncbi:hypothetical protein [Variovorax sp. JS1663]|uniref:hypothetical protein n=1 Tax=Variovorax sp. JS1663 TaxID=1851577 RepID=UPI000B34881B|nr:hypothetical protein [Variovorax sp. JS1663]OUL98422.1 hypothetical protein A8M77_31730 [Variovorax sp. JS1663]
MTGTPLDLTPFGPLLSVLGSLYWLLAIAAVAFVLWYPNRWLLKLSLAALVLTVFVYPVVRHAQTRQVQQDESKARLDAAMALFTERCKTAGERIVRRVKDVDGILLKMRTRMTNDSDQFRLEGAAFSLAQIDAEMLSLTQSLAQHGSNTEEVTLYKALERVRSIVYEAERIAALCVDQNTADYRNGAVPPSAAANSQLYKSRSCCPRVRTVNPIRQERTRARSQSNA